MTAYVAFLLGINIGAHKRIPMADLKKMCGQMGFKNVRTVLASGNVVFEADRKRPVRLEQELELRLEKTFGFKVGVLVRTAAEIRSMVERNPFRGVKAAPDIRFYATFCAEDPVEPVCLPCKLGTYRILEQADRCVFSVLDLKEGNSTDAMPLLAKRFGRKITTRNWNTVRKLL